MTEQLRLMAILAHPDDESLGFGGTLARYAAEGVEVSMVMATRGQRGWPGDPAAYPGPDELGRIREGELRAAIAALGVSRVAFLDEMDGELDKAATPAMLERLTAEIRFVRPQVIVTFGPDGAYGHPDHIAISSLTTSAVLAAADSTFTTTHGVEPFRVSKLYHRIWTAAEMSLFQSLFGQIGITIDGAKRGAFEWPEWAVAARLDTADYWWEVQTAALSHRSQIPAGSPLTGLSPQDLRVLWGTQTFARALCMVPVEPGLEDDLFVGVRIRPAEVVEDDPCGQQAGRLPASV
jgi:LmbE family N-acetylglucosaminyl deacetylase